MWAIFFLAQTGRGASLDQITATECEDTLVWLHHLSERVPFGIKTTEAPHYRRVVWERTMRAPRAVNGGNGFVVFVDHVGNICPSGFLPMARGNLRDGALFRTLRYDHRMRDIDALLRSTALFQRVGPEDRARVSALSQVINYQRGDTIFREGDPSDDLLVIAHGRVKVFKITPAGKDVILEIFGPGDPLGAVAAYEARPYPASAVALEDTTCVLVPRQAFFDLLGQYPSLVRGLLLGLTQRLVELTNRIADLTGGRVEPRFARLFLKMADEVGRPERGGVFIPMVLSRQELADLGGTTIETCIRIMSRWGKQNVVATEKDGFVLRDRKALETLAAG